MVDTRQRGARSASLATAIVGAALLVALLPAGEPHLDTAPHLATYFGEAGYDTRWQRIGHLVLLLGVALAFLAGPWLRRAPVTLADGWRVGIPAVLLVQLAAFPSRPFLGAATLIGAYAWFKLRRGEIAIDPRLWLVPAAAVALLWFAPVAASALDLSGQPQHTYYYDLHYAAVFDPGHRAALGETLYTEVPVYYGAGPTGLVAWLDQVLGPATAGRDVRLVAATQVLVALALALAAAAGRLRGGLVWGVFAAAAAFPAASNALVMPNVAGLRFLALAIAVLALRHLHLTRAPALIAGAVAGLALLYNPETGFAALGGAIAWCVVRRGLGDPVGVAASLGACGAAAVGAFAVAASVGRWVLGFPLIADLDNLLFFAQGHFGLPLGASPVVIAAAGHATAVLVSRGLSYAPSSPRASGRAAVAAVLLVWLAYFANRPDPVNEFLYLALWGVLMVDSWPAVRRGRTELAGAVRALALLVLLPGIMATFQAQLHWALESWRVVATGPRDPDAARLSGVWVARGVAQTVTDQAASVRPDDRVWLSATSYLLARELNRYPEIRPASPFGDVRAADDEVALRQAMRASPVVLIQDTTRLTHDPRVAPWFDALAALEGYQVGPPRPGWTVLQREEGAVQP